jgi:hypothetical protein
MGHAVRVDAAPYGFAGVRDAAIQIHFAAHRGHRIDQQIQTPPPTPRASDVPIKANDLAETLSRFNHQPANMASNPT